MTVRHTFDWWIKTVSLKKQVRIDYLTQCSQAEWRSTFQITYNCISRRRDFDFYQPHTLRYLAASSVKKQQYITFYVSFFIRLQCTRENWRIKTIKLWKDLRRIKLKNSDQVLEEAFQLTRDLNPTPPSQEGGSAHAGFLRN